MIKRNCEISKIIKTVLCWIFMSNSHRLNCKSLNSILLFGRLYNLENLKSRQLSFIPCDNIMYQKLFQGRIMNICKLTIKFRVSPGYASSAQ